METIEEAKQYLKNNWEDGCSCKVCGQHVQLYRYPMFMTSCLALIELYKCSLRIPEETFFHVSRFAEAKQNKIRSPHFAELRFWGLVIPLEHKTKNKNSNGYWCITDKGKQFVLGRISVQKYIRVFNNRFYGFEGEFVDIKDCFNNRFDYEDVMGEYYVQPVINIKQEVLI